VKALTFIATTTTKSGACHFDDRVLFELLILEGAQAGLTWSTVLKKRDRYRQVFDGFPIQNRWAALSEVPAKTSQSDVMSKALSRVGFKFVGSTICYAFMQVAGMVNDHHILPAICRREGAFRSSARSAISGLPPARSTQFDGQAQRVCSGLPKATIGFLLLTGCLRRCIQALSTTHENNPIPGIRCATAPEKPGYISGRINLIDDAIV